MCKWLGLGTYRSEQMLAINFQGDVNTEAGGRHTIQGLCHFLPILPTGGFLACANLVLELGEPDV